MNLTHTLALLPPFSNPDPPGGTEQVTGDDKDISAMYTTLAKAVTMSLDVAKLQMRGNQTSEVHPFLSMLKRHSTKLEGSFKKSGTNNRFRLPMSWPLSKFSILINKLVDCTRRGNADSHTHLKHVMSEMDEAAKYLRQQTEAEREREKKHPTEELKEKKEEE